MKVLFKSLLLIFYLNLTAPSDMLAQRKMEYLDRGVVAVRNSSNIYFISWRNLVTDPESALYNVYAKNITSGSFVKLNLAPLSISNFQSTSGQLSNGAQLYVTSIVNSVESNQSVIFKINAVSFNSYRSADLDISFNPTKDGLEIKYFDNAKLFRTIRDHFQSDKLILERGLHVSFKCS